MVRMIDADKLKKHYAWWEDDRQELFDSIVDRQQTIDAVPVIRCKDCKYFIEQYVNPNGRTYNAHLCDAWVKNTDRDGFCHRAERKEE